MPRPDSRAGAPPDSPLQPVEMTAESAFRFRCHKEIACFNACCRSIDLQLTPYDILRLKNRLRLSSSEFVARYTVPYEMDPHGMPGLKMATRPGTTECIHLTEQGCAVYTDRPAACRYYALGSMGVRKKDASEVEEIYFAVREKHCLGHDEPHTQTVAEYRAQQGLEKYDDMNRKWRELVLKKRSSGPTVGAPSPRSLQLFDMCSYDIDGFRDFMESDGFRGMLELPEAERAELLADEERLLLFAMRFLEQVLFGVRTIGLRPGAREQRIAARRATWQSRRAEQIRAQRERQEAELRGG